jgi:GNAT superfamily N-acetyltransferase
MGAEPSVKILRSAEEAQSVMDGILDIAQMFFDEVPVEEYPAKAQGGFNREAFAEQFIAGFGQGNLVLIVMEEDDRVTGFINGWIYPDRTTGALTAGEEYWYVDPEARGEGILLASAFIGEARKRGCKLLTFATSIDSYAERLEKFYGHIGMKPIATIYMKEL